MDREQTLHDYLQSRLADRIIFPVDPPNAAGVSFVDMDGWKSLVHPAEIAVMADALDDTNYMRFVDALHLFIDFTLRLLDEGESIDVDDARLTAQALTAEQFPEGYVLLDAVFGL